MSDETKIAVIGAFLFGATTIVGLYLSGGAALRYGIAAASASYLAQLVEAYVHLGDDHGVDLPRWPVFVLWVIAVLSAGAGVYVAVFGG